MPDKPKKIKLEDLLLCITPAEIKDLKGMISQKTMQKELTTAYKFLVENPDKLIPKPNKLSSNNWYRIRSKLKDKCLDYMTAKGMEKETLLAAFMASEPLRNSDYPDRYFQYIEELKLTIRNEKYFDANNLWLKLRVNEAQYFYPFTHEKHGDDLRDLFDTMKADLDLFTGIKKIKHGLEAWSHSKNFKNPPVVPLIEEYIQLLGQKPYLDVQLVRIYLAMAKLVFTSSENLVLIEEVLEEIRLEEGTSEEEITTILTFLFNFIFNKIKGGEFEYKKAAGQLYTVCFNRGWFFTENYLNSIHFTNYVLFVAGMGENHFDDARQFIDQNQSLLHPEKRQNAVTLSEAILLFVQKNFKAAFAQIAYFQSSPKNIDEFLKSKTLRIRILFELHLLGEVLPIHDEDFHRELSSFRSYFTKNNPDLSVGIRQSHLNLSNKIEKLNRLWDKHSSSNITEKEVMEESHLACKDWVLEKLSFIKSLK